MRKLVIINIILLAIVLNACGNMQKTNDDKDVQNETTMLTVESTNTIDMTTEVIDKFDENEANTQEYEDDDNKDVVINEDNYKEIILSLCKKENKYDYLLTENMKEKQKLGIIDFNALNKPQYNTLQVFDFLNDDYHSNFNQHIVCISIDYKDEVYDDVQNTYYYTLKYFTDNTGLMPLIDDIVIINQVSYWAGSNSYAPEYYFFNKDDDYWVNREKILRIINGFDTNLIKLGATENLIKKFPNYENIGFLSDKNYSYGGVNFTIDYEKLKAYGIKESDIVCVTRSINSTKWYKIIPKFENDLLDDLDINLILEESIDNSELFKEFEEDLYYNDSDPILCPNPIRNLNFISDLTYDYDEKIKMLFEYDKNCLSEAVNTIAFGKFEQDNNIDNGKEYIEWIPLISENDKVLLLSKNILFAALDENHISTFDKEFSDVTKYYESSYFRKYLNEYFLNECFTDEEKSIIQTSNIENYTNNDNLYMTYELNDKIFLLSKYEIEKYFNGSKYLVSAKGTIASTNSNEQFREIFGDSSLHIEGSFDNENKWCLGNAGFLLRDYADYDFDNNCVNQYGINGQGELFCSDIVPPINGVRPAMWVKYK